MDVRGWRAKTQITFAEFLPFPLCLAGSLRGRMICNCITQILLIEQGPSSPMRLRHMVYATPVGACLKIGQPLAGAVLSSNSICYTGRGWIKPVREEGRGERWRSHPGCHCMWNYGLNCEMPGTVAMKQCLPRMLSSNCYEETLENGMGNWKWMGCLESFRQHDGGTWIVRCPLWISDGLSRCLLHCVSVFPD